MGFIGIVGWSPRPRPRLPRVVFRIRRGVETGSPLATVAFRQMNPPVELRHPSAAVVGGSARRAPNEGLADGVPIAARSKMKE